MAALDDFLALPFVKQNEPLARHTTMKVGGPAQIWAEPNSREELSHVLRLIHQSGVPLFVLGNGSNIVASDAGFEGIVLHLGRGFNFQRAENEILIAGGAAMLPRLTHFALQNNLGNFEWACGVPGGAGGSLWGNAGARGFNGEAFESRDCAADFVGCTVFNRQGEQIELGKTDVEFAYRRSSLGDLIVCEARFSLRKLDENQAKKHREAVKELLAKRRASQPVNAASAGCIWKNPKNGVGAGALIEELGLKNFAVGNAKISEIHGNFAVNAGGATAGQVRELVAQIEEIVREKTGIELEREARFLG